MKSFTLLVFCFFCLVVYAQNELKIQVVSSNNVSSIFINSDLVETGVCSNRYDLQLVLINSNSCFPEKTRMGEGSGLFLGNRNDKGMGCRARSELFFSYPIHDPKGLLILDSVVQSAIFNQQTFALYAPFDFNSDTLKFYAPGLLQTMETYFSGLTGTNMEFIAICTNGTDFKFSNEFINDSMQLSTVACAFNGLNVFGNTSINWSKDEEGNLQFTSGKESIKRIIVYDLTGKVVFNQEVVSLNKVQLMKSDLNLSNNLYFARIVLQSKEEIIKISL